MQCLFTKKGAKKAASDLKRDISLSTGYELT